MVISMKFRWEKKFLYWGITAFSVIVLSISFFILMYNFNIVYSGVQTIITILTPFILGFIIAYLLIPVMDMFENKCFLPLLKKTKRKFHPKLPRILAILCTIFLALALVIGLLFMVIPQLWESIDGIVKELPANFKKVEEWALALVSSNSELEKIFAEEFNDINGTLIDWAKNNFLPQLNNIISGVTSGLIELLTFLKNIFVGLIVSIYVMYSKEQFCAQGKKVVYGLFPIKVANSVTSITRRSHKVFGGFIIGKLIDSLIIGCICFIGMSIFGMPYALLISVIIAVTNIIPFFGPFIGAIPSAFLILMKDPLTCLYFIIFIILLQQFDGNILGPKILGDSTGLSAFWVIFSILLFGGIWGFVGMIIGVPTFAIIYSLIVELLEYRLKKHELPVKTAQFRELESISPIDYEPAYANEEVKIHEPKKSKAQKNQNKK